MSHFQKREQPKQPDRNPRIVIPFTEDELMDIMNGETFQWTFLSDTGRDVDVLLKLQISEEDDTLSELDPIVDDTPIDDTF